MLATLAKAADLAAREALAEARVDLAAECEWDPLMDQCSCSTRKSSKN